MRRDSVEQRALFFSKRRIELQMQAIKNLLAFGFIVCMYFHLHGQEKFVESVFYKSIFYTGASVGASQYIGDLNPRLNPKSIRSAAGVHIGKNFMKEAVGIQLSYQTLHLYAADANTKDPLQLIRNLDFQSNVEELSFMVNLRIAQLRNKFNNATLYFQFGAGSIWFDPYTVIDNDKIYLRPLGTEGQFSYLTSNPGTYSTNAFSVPIGLLLKVPLSNAISLNLQYSFRFTSTGYLDDVYGRYAGFESFPLSGEGYNGQLARQLQNRSLDISFGHKGTARGNLSNDQFMTASLGLEYQFWKYVYKHRLKYKRIRIPSASEIKSIEK
jgi:hypothetical protein